MQVIVVKDYQEGARKAADIIEKIVREKPDCTLGLATGSSPVGMYRELARRCSEEGLDFSKVHSVNLDEYAGLEGTHEQSYRYFMNDNLFDHINIDKANTYVAKGTGDLKKNLKEFNDILNKTDIDIQVLGVGPDGHLGFNEPGETLYDGAPGRVHNRSKQTVFRIQRGSSNACSDDGHGQYHAGQAPADDYQRKQAGSGNQTAHRRQD